MSWYLKVISNYAVFRGRARRREYWMFTLFTMIISVLLTILDFMLGTEGVITYTYTFNGTVVIQFGLLYVIYSLLVLLPTWAVSARRLHDIDRSGWWLLLTFVPIVGWIVLLVFSVLDGTRGANRFGADPKSPVPQFA